MTIRPSNRKRNLWAVGLLEVQPTDCGLEVGFGPRGDHPDAGADTPGNPVPCHWRTGGPIQLAHDTGRPFAFANDEVYGTFTVPSFGWPWGWARLWNVAGPRQPHILGEYKIFENTQAFQGAPADDATTEATRSYSSHNPTLTRNLALIAWHTGGLQAIDISDPGQPVQAGWFTPTPEATVATEDPALSAGTDARGNKVVMWSYPITKDGLVYVVDVRNGLYVLRYTGAAGGEVNGLTFLEGNSNLGDAGRLDRSSAP